MRLKLILTVVEAEKYKRPRECPYGCGGKRFILRQTVKKQVCDTAHDEVDARRYGCLSCQRKFRVYPQGVNHRQFIRRAIGMAVMLYLLRLSYRAVVLMLEALGLYIGKTTVYEAVQAAAERLPGMKRGDLLQGYRTLALGSDLTSVKCKGKWLSLGVTVDAITGMTLSIDKLSAEDAQTLKEWPEPIIETVDARVLVADDADALKTAADQNGVYHQVCKSHVGRNTNALVEQLQASFTNGFNQSLGGLSLIGGLWLPCWPIATVTSNLSESHVSINLCSKLHTISFKAEHRVAQRGTYLVYGYKFRLRT